MAYVHSKLSPLQGAHPVSSTTIYLPSASTVDSCSLHLYYSLPPLIFVDTHELAQRGTSYAFRHWGTKDIEKPVHALEDQHSELLVSVPATKSNRAGNDVEIEVNVPLHLRYGAPKRSMARSISKFLPGDSGRAYEQLRVEWPKAFLLCPYSHSAKPTWSKTALSLPPHVLSSLPGSRSQDGSIIVPIPVRSDSIVDPSDTVVLPVGEAEDIVVVEIMTALTVLVCFLWLVRVSCRTARRLNRDRNNGQSRKTD